MVKARTAGRRSIRRSNRRRKVSAETQQMPKTSMQTIAVGNEGVVAALYVTQPTDTPQRIAERFNVELELFLSVNAEIGRTNRLYTGQIVQIPLTPPTLPIITRVATEYVVQEGDTLFAIAQQFRVSLLELQKANPLVSADRLFAGQVLLIPTVAEGTPPNSVLLYVVQPGDTPAMVAGLFGFSITALTDANPQRINPERLYAGEFIVLPVASDAEPSDTPVFDRVRYVVQPMDSIEEVARQFEVWPYGLGRLNAIVAPIPGLILQLPPSIPIPAPPPAPEGFPSVRPAPFGRQLAIADDDSVYVPFPADFRFPFFGQQSADGVWVNSNGNITFHNPDQTFLPTTDAFIEGPPRIAPFWTDLTPDAAVGTGGVYVDFYFDSSLGNTRMAITWDRVPIFGIEQFYTVQVLLDEDGDIEMGCFAIPPLPQGEIPRILIGLSAGQAASSQDANVFVYNGKENARRAGDNAEQTPAGSLNGRILMYRYDQQQGLYRLSFT